MTGSASAPARVLITADAVGGVWQYTVDLARVLIEEGMQVAVATMGPRPSASQTAQLPADAQLFLSDYPLEWSANPWSSIDAAGEWLLAIQHRFGSSLVHLNGYAHAILPWNCPVLVVAHSCVVSWWHSVHGCEPPQEWDEYRQRVGAGLAACHQVVAPSAYLAAELVHSYQLDPSLIRVIPNYSSASVQATDRKEDFCLAAGRRWDRAKNLDLLPAIALASPMPVYCAGKGEGASDGAVIWLGLLPQSELLAYMRRARIFLHPALYEPFGLVILEAARSRCCLLLADTPVSRELWDGAALFADPRDPREWCEALRRLSNDPALCGRLGEAASTHAERYSQAAFASAYLSVYESLLTGNSLRRTGPNGVAA